MPTCSTWGNDYAAAFAVTAARGESYHSDSIERAARKLAPTCEVCGVRILGHGLQAGDRFFCCDHCATQAGVEGLNDRVEGWRDKGMRPIPPSPIPLHPSFPPAASPGWRPP